MQRNSSIILKEIDKIVSEAPKLFEALGKDKWD